MTSSMPIRCLTLGLTLALGACSSDDDGPGQPTNESWTIGIYMAADNNLDRAATNDINEILGAQVPENTSALILVDRAELGEYGGFGSIDGLAPHSTAKWLRITGNTIEELQDLGEIDMADPETVRLFLERLAEEDVDRKAAIFWDHGSSFTFGGDDSGFSGAMRVNEIAAQFREDPEDENSPYRKVDIVGFDACLMSSVEALAEFNDVADFFVASAELEPGDGWDYSALFNFMGRNPDLTPRDLAAAIVDGYANYYSDNPRRAGGLQVTQAAWSTGTGEVEAAIQALAEQYEAASTDEADNYNLIADLFSAQSKSTFYNRRTDNPAETTSWIDVGEFLANHTEQGGPAIAAAAETVRQALERIRVANRADGRDELVMGLSIYFPANRVGRNTGASDRGTRSVETDSRLLDGGYGIIQSLIDKDDPSSALGSLRATDAEAPSLEACPDLGRCPVVGQEVAPDFEASDDVMLASGYGLLLYRTDDDEQLALVGARNASIGVADYSGVGSLPLVGVVVGPENAEPVSGRVGFISRESGRYSVPVVVVQGERRDRGVLILSEDGTIEGAGALREDGTWALLAWEDAQAVPDVEIAPLWFTVDLETGDYETNEGDATPIADVNIRFVDLTETSRLSVVLSVTDIAGNTTVDSAPVE